MRNCRSLDDLSWLGHFNVSLRCAGAAPALSGMPTYRIKMTPSLGASNDLSLSVVLVQNYFTYVLPSSVRHFGGRRTR